MSSGRTMLTNTAEYFKSIMQSRKFILALLGLAASSHLIWAGRIDGQEFVMLNSILGGAYMGADAYVARYERPARRPQQENDYPPETRYRDYRSEYRGGDQRIPLRNRDYNEY